MLFEPVEGVLPALLRPAGEIHDLALRRGVEAPSHALGQRGVLGCRGEEPVPVPRPALQQMLAVPGVGEGPVEVEYGQWPAVPCHGPQPSEARNKDVAGILRRRVC